VRWRANDELSESYRIAAWTVVELQICKAGVETRCFMREPRMHTNRHELKMNSELNEVFEASVRLSYNRQRLVYISVHSCPFVVQQRNLW